MSRQKLAFSIVLLTYLLIVFGGYVASSESGMGCGPEWPLCNGEVIPVLQGDTLIEFGHRVIGAILFFMTIWLFVKIKKTSTNRMELMAANWMLVLLSVQLIMGAIVVFYHLPSFIITIHLLIAMVYMAIIIGFWRAGRERAKQNANLTGHLSWVTVFTFITIGLGAYIKHQHYGLACSWFSCSESLLPVTMPELLQSLHRLLALVVTFYSMFITYRAFKDNDVLLQKRMVFACILIILQIGVGIITILTSVSLAIAVLHLAVGTLLFAVLVEARIVCRR